MAGGSGSRMNLPSTMSKANLEVLPGVTLLRIFIAKMKAKVTKHNISDTALVIVVNDENKEYVETELKDNK